MRVHQADRVQLVGVRKADGLAVKEWTRQLESVKTKMVQKRLWKEERHRRDEEVSLICQEKVVRRIDWRLGTPGYRIQGIAKRTKKREGSGGGTAEEEGSAAGTSEEETMIGRQRSGSHQELLVGRPLGGPDSR